VLQQAYINTHRLIKNKITKNRAVTKSNKSNSTMIILLKSNVGSTSEWGS